MGRPITNERPKIYGMYEEIEFAILFPVNFAVYNTKLSSDCSVTRKSIAQNNKKVLQHIDECYRHNLKSCLLWKVEFIL